MKNIKHLLFLSISFVLICSFTQKENWALFETKNYKILFPKAPTEQTKIVNTAVGELKLTVELYQVTENDSDDNLAYSVSETEYPDSTINSDKKEILDDFFKNAIAGAVNNVHGKLLTETIITINGYPGREIRIDFRDGLGVIKMRAFLVKNKLYMLQTITDANEDFNVSINRFMDSFELKI